jgi:membrane protease YdiL (CAAX protease family)
VSDEHERRSRPARGPAPAAPDAPPPPDDGPRPLTPRGVWFEVIALYLGSCLVIRVIKALVDGGVMANDWLVLVALVFFYTPGLAWRWNRWEVDRSITDPEPFKPALWQAAKWLVVLVAIIYPAFLVGYHVLQTEGFHWFTSDVLGMRRPYPRFAPEHGFSGGQWLTLTMQLIYQLICVGWAEEFFYRGYMQTRLNTIYRPDRFRLFGASFGWSLPITCVLFTVGHSLVTWQWWQPFILFPALVFGWLRARTGSIWAGALFHAWSNSVMIVMDHIYGITVLEPTTFGDLLGDLGNLFRFGG